MDEIIFICTSAEQWRDSFLQFFSSSHPKVISDSEKILDEDRGRFKQITFTKGFNSSVKLLD